MSCLLTAFGLILLRIRHSFRSPLLTGIIFTLLIIGGLSRHNSLLAVAPLVLLYFWPDIRAQGKPLLSIFMKRLCVVTLASSLSLVTAKVIFEEAITQPTKMGLINTIFLFDLVGISTRIGVNLLPGSWRPDQTEAILTKCYQPHLVDSLLWGSCSFVAEALHDRVKERAEGDTSFRPNFPWPPWFGEREAWAKDRPLFPAWLQAVTHHPLAYLQHRLTHFQILFRPAYIFLAPDAEAYRYGFRLNGVYHTIERIVIFLGELPGLKLMFSVGFWYVASLGIFGLSLWTFSKKRENEAAHSQAYYALIASASASLYSLPLFFVSIADQYRYAFWTAAATCVACLFLWAARRAERKEI